MKRVLKALLWVVAIVLVVLVAVSLLAGPIAKGYINKHGEGLTGRKVHVDHVGVNLLAGNVNLRNLEVYEDDGKTVFAGFDTLRVGAHLLKLPFQTLHIKHLSLAGLHANIEQQGSRFNFSSLIDHFASDSTEEKDTTPSNWTLKFYDISLSHARLEYTDMMTGKSWKLPDINLRVPGFVMDGKEDSEGGLNINFDRGGHLNMYANLDTKENGFKVDLTLTDFKVENIESYLADAINYEQLDGSVNVKLTANGKVDEIMKSKIGGNVNISNLSLDDSQGQIAGFSDLDVAIANINLDANSFDIASLRLNGLKARYEQWDGYSNLSRLTASNEPTPTVTMQTTVEEPEKKESTSKPIRLHIGALRIEDAAITYTDHTLPDEFSFPITGLNISADDITTSGDNNAQIRASLPGGGHLMVRWNGNIDNWKQHQNIFLTVKGLNMQQLSPLTVAYTGQPIEDGIFGLTTRATIENSQLDNTNKIDIYNARVGDRRKDVEPEMKVPLKTALYILRDKDEKILIDLPITGNIDSPEFNYMKIVWKTLGNLLVKVATSPARALGNALGINNEDLEFLAIDPHQRGLTSEQYHQLSLLASMMQSDSLINLIFEMQMPEAANDTIARGYEWRNQQIMQYMIEQGVPASRIRIEQGEPQTDRKARTGYAIKSEITIEE